MGISLVKLIKMLPRETRMEVIPELLKTGDITEQDLPEIEAQDVSVSMPRYERALRTDPEQRYLWQLFHEYPRYLARALAQAFPKLYYSHGFAMRMVMGLKAKLGNIVVSAPENVGLYEPAVFMEKLPDYVQRDLLALYRECRFRECLYFMSRERETGFQYIEEEMTRVTTSFDRGVLKEVRMYCESLYEMRFPDFITSIAGSLFPSFHVRWWIDRIQDVPRCLCMGGTSTQKTAFAVVAMHHYECQKVLVVCTANARIQWARETASYFRRPQNRVLLVGKPQDIEGAVASDAQYTIIAYSTLIRGNVLKKLQQVPFDGFVWDECQYGNNVSGSGAAGRAKACAELIRSLPLKRLIALSATPWENDPRELGAVASAVMPEVVPTPDSFRKWGVRDPRFLREFMARHVLEVEIDEIRDLPQIEPKPWKDLFGAEFLDLAPQHEALYRFVQDDESLRLKAMQKIHHLLLAVIHPQKLRDWYTWPEEWDGRFQDWRLSTKLVWLKDRIDQELRDDAKVVIGSGIYADGITRTSADEEEETVWVGRLLKEWYGDEHVLILDGNVTPTIDASGSSVRDRLIGQWRRDPRVRILLVSMRACPDSVHLTLERQFGIKKLFITALSFGWTPWTQFLGRFYRVGQQVPISYAVPILRNTIDEGLLGLITEKHRGNQLFKAQVDLTEEEWSYYASRDRNVRRLLEASRRPVEHVTAIAALIKGRGEEENEHTLAASCGMSTNAEVLARSYIATQEFSASGHVSRCMEVVIGEFLREDRFRAEEILDAGCGPLTLERRLNYPVYGIDMNPYMVEFGRSESSHGGVNASVGYLSQLSADWGGKFNLTVCALALHWSNSIGKTSERMTILSELVRVTTPAGLIWIAVLESMMDEILLSRWADALREMEFIIIEELTGFAQSRDTGKRRTPFRFWSLCFAPSGKAFLLKNAKAFHFLFEEELIKRHEGGSAQSDVPELSEQMQHRSFEIVGLTGEKLAADAAAKRVIEAVTGIGESHSRRGSECGRIQPNDWRTYVRLQQRRKAQPVPK